MKKINLQNWLQFPKWMFGQCTKQFGRRNNPLHALNQRAPDEGNWKSPQFPGPLHRRSSRGLSPYRRFLLWIWARRCEQRELIHSRNERQETRLVPQGLCSGTLDTLPPHALKGQKLLAQGSTLGISAISLAPCRGKSFMFCLEF